MLKYLVLLFLFSHKISFADLPPNLMRRPILQTSTTSNITEERFNAIIDEIVTMFAPIVAKHGAILTARKDWQNDMVNAYARKEGNNWLIEFYGGYARHEKMTEDGFSYVVCHEVGHHLAGHYYYFYLDFAAEGSADYFASQACLRKLWQNQREKNAAVALNAPTSVRQACLNQWRIPEEQNLCVRSSLAGMPNAQITGDIYGDPPVLFDTHDASVAPTTVEFHPHGQCRFDTSLAGSLCGKGFNFDLIPGYESSEGKNSYDAQQIAFRYSCSKMDSLGQRPTCWFKEKHSL